MLLSLFIFYPLIYMMIGLSFYLEQIAPKIKGEKAFQVIIYYLQLAAMIDQMIFYRPFKMLRTWVKSEYGWRSDLVIWHNSDLSGDELRIFASQLNIKFQHLGLEFGNLQTVKIHDVENVYRFTLLRSLFAYHIFYLDEVTECVALPGLVFKMGRSYEMNNVVTEMVKGLQITNYIYKCKPWTELDVNTQNKFVMSIFAEKNMYGII